jgi:deoxyadenosine/deoxycytidine kinase
MFTSFTVADFLFQKSLIFANENLNENEAKLYRMLFDMINTTLPKPDIVLYLYAPVEKLLANIKRRGRDYEQNITAEYLENIQQAYLSYFKLQTGNRVVLLDIKDLNIADNEADFDKVVALLQQDFTPSLHYV